MTKKRSKYKTAFERKQTSISHGMNCSSKAQLRRIAKVDTKKQLPQVPLGNIYFRNKNVWVDKGKFCYVCGQVLGDNLEVIDKHRYICESINKSRGIDDAST